MLAAEIKRLREIFDAWSRGAPFPTEDAWLRFGRDLAALQFKVAMLELGVDLAVVDVAMAAAQPNSNVVVLQPRPRNTGGAS